MVERPLYFVFRGVWDGGDDVMGVKAPAREWQFAEGCTRQGFNTWLCLGNPQGNAIDVTVDYFLGDGRSLSRTYSVAARSRRTVDVNLEIGPKQDVGMKATSAGAFMAERPMYFNYHGSWRGGHVATGATAAGTVWRFAEGCTR